MDTNGTTSTLPAEIPRAHAPGKIILSGEHSVVYGAPAIAAAVAQYTEVWFEPIHRSEGLRTAFEQVSQGAFYPLSLLSDLKKRLDARFSRFLRGELQVQNILQRPDDLVIYTLASLVQKLPVPGVSTNHKVPVPGRLGSHTSLPLGAGMGSSASVIAATFVLYENLLNLVQTKQERFERVQTCERLQHGKGGAIDAASVVYGGVNRVEGARVTQPDIAREHGLLTGNGWYWVLHGVPVSSTGECVTAVRQSHGSDTALWQEFAQCTNALQSVLEANANPSEVLRHNQQLLTRIGVVPARTQGFISAVEEADGSAKLCGAGSVRGDHGGVVLVHMEDPDAMETLMSKYADLRWDGLRIASAGAAQGAAP